MQQRHPGAARRLPPVTDVTANVPFNGDWVNDGITRLPVDQPGCRARGLQRGATPLPGGTFTPPPATPASWWPGAGGGHYRIRQRHQQVVLRPVPPEPAGPGQHLYTTDPAYANWVVATVPGWVIEGAEGHTRSTPDAGTGEALYALYQISKEDHFYTNSVDERNPLLLGDTTTVTIPGSIAAYVRHHPGHRHHHRRHTTPCCNGRPPARCTRQRGCGTAALMPAPPAANDVVAATVFTEGDSHGTPLAQGNQHRWCRRPAPANTS